MLFYREDFSFLMKMVDRRQGMASCNAAEGAVLYDLEAVDGRLRVEGKNDRRAVVEERTNERLESERQTLLVMTK